MTDKQTLSDAELQTMCAEILAWQETGVLPGNALRDYAQRAWAGHHDALQMAESSVSTAALRALAKRGTPAAGEPAALLEAAAKIAEGYPKYGDSIAEEIRALLPGTAQQKNMAYPADELLQVALAYKQYIDALPGDVVAKLPAMPGIDGDWAGEVLDRAARAQTAPAPGVEQVTPVQEIDTALHAYAQAFTARVNGWTSQNGDDFPGARVALFKAISAYSRYLADQRPPAPTA